MDIKDFAPKGREDMVNRILSHKGIISESKKPSPKESKRLKDPAYNNYNVCPFCGKKKPAGEKCTCSASRQYAIKESGEIVDMCYGVPEQKKYPLYDEKHVRSAIKLFGHVDPRFERELALAIIARMKKFGMSYKMVGKDNRLYKYIPKKLINEAVDCDIIEESRTTEWYGDIDEESEKEKSFEEIHGYNFLEESVTFVDNAGQVKTMSTEDYVKDMHEYHTETEIDKYTGKKRVKVYKLISTALNESIKEWDDMTEEEQKKCKNDGSCFYMNKVLHVISPDGHARPVYEKPLKKRLTEDGHLSKDMTVEEIAKKHGVSVEELEKQVKMGIEVEHEHTSDDEEAKRIALDHLYEFPDYYTRLDKMEEEGEDALKNEKENLAEASASQIKSNSPIAQMVKSYLQKYGVRFTWRVNKHLATVESLFKDDPKKVKLAIVAMPIYTQRSQYNGVSTEVEVNEGTRIILFLDDKILVYGKGILTGRKARKFQLEDIHDVRIEEGMVWSKVYITYKQSDNAFEDHIALGRVHKNATSALERFFQSYSNAHFTKTFDQVDKEDLTESVAYSDYEDLQEDMAITPGIAISAGLIGTKMIANIISANKKKKKKQLVGVLTESVIDPVHDKLCQDLFDGDELRDDVLKYIKDAIEDWKSTLKISPDIKAIHIVGSLLSYQYNSATDVDVHIMVNDDINAEDFKLLRKSSPKADFIPDTMHPLEFSVLHMKDEELDNCLDAYDLLADKWIKRSEKPTFNSVPSEYIAKIARFFLNGYDVAISNARMGLKDLKELEARDVDANFTEEEKIAAIFRKRDELMELKDSLKLARRMTQAFRSEGYSGENIRDFNLSIEINLPNDPHYSINEMVFKTIQKYGQYEEGDKIHDELKENIERINKMNAKLSKSEDDVERDSSKK